MYNMCIMSIPSNAIYIPNKNIYFYSIKCIYF